MNRVGMNRIPREVKMASSGSGGSGGERITRSRMDRSLERPTPAQDLIDKGREFYCTVRGCEDRRLGSGEVTGNNVNGWWHRGHIGHRVVVG